MDPLPSRPLWRKSENLAVVESHGGRRFAILELGASQPVILTDTAAGIWRALDEPASLADVAERVAADYGMPAAEIRDQIGTFLGALHARGLARPD